MDVFGRRHMHTGFWWGNMKERDHFDYVGCGWEDNIKMDLQEIGFEGVSRSVYFRVGTSGRLL
jgi:hypothetical protein